MNTKTIKQYLPAGEWEIDKSPIGASENAYIANNGQKKLFIKFGVNISALKRLSELGVAPKVISAGEDEGKTFVIQEFVEGQKPDKAWFEQNIESLARFIKTYHQDKELKSILEKVDKHTYSENINVVLKGLDNDINKSNSDLFAEEEIKKVLNLLKNKAKLLKPVLLVPTHTDPNPQNFLLTEKGIVMVDWDDIFLSDPMKDIGLILWWYIPRNMWGKFFDTYGQELDEEKLRWWIARNTFSIAAWYGKQDNREYVKFFIKDALMALEGNDNSQIFY